MKAKEFRVSFNFLAELLIPLLESLRDVVVKYECEYLGYQKTNYVESFACEHLGSRQDSCYRGSDNNLYPDNVKERIKSCHLYGILLIMSSSLIAGSSICSLLNDSVTLDYVLSSVDEKKYNFSIIKSCEFNENEIVLSFIMLLSGVKYCRKLDIDDLEGSNIIITYVLNQVNKCFCYLTAF